MNKNSMMSFFAGCGNLRTATNIFVVQNKTVIEWSMADFSGIDDGICSPEFSTPSRTASNEFMDLQWQLQVHSNEQPGYVTIWLRNLTDTEASLTLEVRLSNSWGLIHECKIKGKSGKTESCSLDLYVGGALAEGSHVSELEYLKVVCYISDVSSCATVDAEREDDSASGHTAHYENLLETGKFGDVKFNIAGKTMHLHKAILTSASVVFRAMFDHEMREQKESVVDVVDVDFDMMKETLRYIYARRVIGIERIAAELFVVADRYAVEGLKRLCENELADKLSVDNVLSRFELSMKYGMANLKAKVLDFVVRDMKNLVGRREFKELSSDCKDELFKYISTKTISDPHH